MWLMLYWGVPLWCRMDGTKVKILKACEQNYSLVVTVPIAKLAMTSLKQFTIVKLINYHNRCSWMNGDDKHSTGHNVGGYDIHWGYDIHLINFHYQPTIVLWLSINNIKFPETPINYFFFIPLLGLITYSKTFFHDIS